jgi:hypothetical protein
VLKGGREIGERDGIRLDTPTNYASLFRIQLMKRLMGFSMKFRACWRRLAVAPNDLIC